MYLDNQLLSTRSVVSRIGRKLEMPRKKAKDFMSCLGAGEPAHVLSELLKRHPDLCDEARSIAESLTGKNGQEASGEDGGPASRRGRREQGLRSR